MSLVELHGVQVKFGEVEVLHDVNLTVDEGEIYGLLGPNGAGKTTTIGVITGLVPAAAGDVRVLGADTWRNPEVVRRSSGVLPERNGFYDWMSATEYLAFFAALHDRTLSENDLQARLAQVGLAPRPKQRIGSFSHGMKQRLGLARALINDPRLLILDEPTNGLDPLGRREVHDILVELSERRGVGILFCTHLLDDVAHLCRRIGIISEGRTVMEGKVADLMATADRSPLFWIRLGGKPPETGLPESLRLVAREDGWCLIDLDRTVEPSAAWRELMLRGWPVEEIWLEGGGLEDVYLHAIMTTAA